MKLSESIMGTNVFVEILDPQATGSDIDAVLSYFHAMESLFNPRLKTSDIAKINNGALRSEDAHHDVKKVLILSEETRLLTGGYFDISLDKFLDPSGLLKGYLIREASLGLLKKGFKNFYIGIGADIDIKGHKNAKKWKVGIGNPPRAIELSDSGIATTAPEENEYIIYNPLNKRIPNDLQSVTVVATDVFEADRFSTALFAMGLSRGKEYVDSHEGIEAIFTTRDGEEVLSNGFFEYLKNDI